MIDFGTTTQRCGEIGGSFNITNITSQLPLCYLIESSSPCIKILSPSKDSISEAEPQRKNSDPSFNKKTIQFILTHSEWGLSISFIKVTNINNRDQVLIIEVRAFVDNQRIHFRTVNRIPEPYTSTPLMYFKEIYISPLEDSKRSKSIVEISAVSSPYNEKYIEVENPLDELVELCPKSNLNVLVRWLNLNGSAVILEQNFESFPLESVSKSTSYHQCGSRVIINGKGTIGAFISAPIPITHDERWLSGSQSELKGMLLLDNNEDSVTLKAVSISGSYAVSKGGLENLTFEAGKIGHLNNWAKIPFSFKLKNYSGILIQRSMFLNLKNSPLDIPLVFALATPKEIEIITDVSCIGSLQTLEINAILNPKMFESQETGSRCSSIRINNIFNESNILTFKVTSWLTSFDIKFERLISG